MIEERVPFSYIDRIKEVMEKELEYELFDGDDRKEWLRLSAKIEMLNELKRMWLKYESENA